MLYVVLNIEVDRCFLFWSLDT